MPKKTRTYRVDSGKAIQMEILKILSNSPQPSMFKLANYFKDSKFPVVRRNILKLKNYGLLTVGESGKRKAMKIELTSKGLTVLLQEKAVDDRFQQFTACLREVIYSKEDKEEIKNFFSKYPELKFPFGLHGIKELLDEAEKEQTEYLLVKYPWLKKIMKEP